MQGALTPTDASSVEPMEQAARQGWGQAVKGLPNNVRYIRCHAVVICHTQSTPSVCREVQSTLPPVAGHKGRLQVPPALLVGAAALLPYLGSAVCQDDVKLCSHAQQHSAGAQAYFLVLENRLALIMQTEASVRCTAGHTRSAGRRRSPGLHARTRAAGVLPARVLHQC